MSAYTLITISYAQGVWTIASMVFIIAYETVISVYGLMHVTEHNKFMLFPHPKEDSYLPCMQWPTP